MKPLPRSARVSAFVRSFTIQGSWNYRTMIGGGFGFALLPVLRGLFEGERFDEALARHCDHFNSHPYLAGLALGATSCTDVTGFGLLGHLANILDASDLDADLGASDVPLLEGVLALAEAGVVPGGSKRNLRHVEPITEFAPEVDELTRLLLADAQTSGGLLLCVPPERADDAVRMLRERGVEVASVIGAIASTPR